MRKTESGTEERRKDNMEIKEAEKENSYLHGEYECGGIPELVHSTLIFTFE